MNSKHHCHGHHPLMRAVHGLLLLGWLLSSQGVAPAFCLAAAFMDGDHSVKVGASREGDLTVVLSHDDNPARDTNFHEHDFLCTLLLVFAEPSTGSPDHILAFKSMDDASCRELGASSSPAAADMAPPPVFMLHAQTPAPDTACLRKHPCAPAWSPGLAWKTGRTIMLC